MSRFFLHLCGDIALWAVCIVGIRIMADMGWIDDAGTSLAGVALFMALRAYTKAEVNTAHNKNSEVA